MTTSDEVRQLREMLTTITDDLVRDYQGTVPTGRIISVLVQTRGQLRCGGLHGVALLRAADVATRTRLDARTSGRGDHVDEDYVDEQYFDEQYVDVYVKEE